jgi:hypothetical protein
MNKYRVKHVPTLGYFAQVKRGFFYSWETIGLHANGFGEYNEVHYDYPLNQHFTAVQLVQQYAKYNDVNYGFITYTDIDL